MQFMLNNFTAGEVSPKLAARSDLERYKNGCKELRNFWIQALGGVYGRPGTRFVAAARDASTAVRIIPFEFSSTQAYIVEMSNGFFRFYKDNGRIETSPGVPYEIASVYATSQLFDVRYAQSADTMYMAHSACQPRKLTRTGHAAWTFNTATTKDGPYQAINDDATKTLTSSVTAVGASGTLTATGHSPFSAASVGQHYRLANSSGTNWGWVIVTGYTSPTVVNITVQDTALFGTTATKWWREYAWGGTKGWPKAVGFSEERLFFASSDLEPQTLWGSASGDFQNFSPGTNDDDAVTYTVASGYVNPLHWIVEDRGLFLGTTKSEHRLTGGEAPLTPTNARVVPATIYGSKPIQPLKAGGQTVFVQRAGKKIRALQYSFSSDSYSAPDLTLLSDHITSPGVTDWCYQQEPDSVLACALSDGQMACMTYIAEQQVMGWSRSSTDGAFESVAAIPIAGQDQIWAAVRRTINGSTVRYIEYFDPSLHMDCALSYSGAPVTGVTGAGHLEGKTVAVVGEGAVYNSAVVTGGAVDLTPAASVSAITVGIPFTPRLVTLKPELQTSEGSIQGKRKHYTKIGVRVLDSLGITVNGTQAESRSSDDEMDQVPDQFTGDIIDVNTGWDKDGLITIEQTQPLPINVLGVFGSLEMEE
jgi:hypothetical protein